METAKKHISYCIVFLMLCLTGMVLFGHNVIAEAAGAHDTYVGWKGCELIFQKVWEDDGDESKRPNEITFTVDLADTFDSKNDKPNEPITLKASENWTYTVPSLYGKTSYGYYEGTLKELNVDGYKLDGVTVTESVKDDKVIVTLKNKLKATGSLTVSKTVAGNAGDQQKAFNFTVRLSDTSINGTFGDMTFTDGVATFTLKHEESKTAAGLPAGVTYEVTETEANQDGYATAKTGDTGTIAKDATSTAAFTNTKDEFGSLTVSKTVAGNAGDQQKAFNFTVRLSDTSINGTFGDMTFTDGVATFTLKHGKSKTAARLPAGVTYEVTETEADQDGYATAKTGDTGTIEKDVISTAAFTNTKDASPVDPDKPTDPKKPTDDVPKTGDETNLTLWTALLGISGTCMIVVLLGIKRKYRGKQSKR